MCKACSQKNKITNPLLKGATSVLMSLNNDDFVTKLYIGETKPYKGLDTGIIYGIKNTNTKFMIHKKDLAKDLENFTDIEPEMAAINIEPEKVKVKRNVRRKTVS